MINAKFITALKGCVFFCESDKIIFKPNYNVDINPLILLIREVIALS